MSSAGGSSHAVLAMKPVTLIDIGEERVVEGSKGTTYTIKRHDAHYSCTCPAWLFAKGSSSVRTCKHLKALLGEQFEFTRLLNSPASTPRVKQRAKREVVSETEDEEGATPSPRKRSRLMDSPASQQDSRDSSPQPHKGAISVMLAATWDLDGKTSPRGLWASEKLDGVRAYWDGTKLWSRNKKQYKPPKWWRDRLPIDVRLDGELFGARDGFDRLSGMVRKGAGPQWKQIHYVVFDVVRSGPVEERWRVAKSNCVDGELSVDEIVKRKESCIAFLPVVEVESKDHLRQLLKMVENVGGEGLMLRKPRSKYIAGRSQEVLKVKTWYYAEAIVIGYKAGDTQGRHSERMGALHVGMECGKQFDLGGGFTDALRDIPPAIGAVVVYKFQELSHKHTPRFPIYLGVAVDKTKAKDAVVRSSLLRAVTAATRDDDVDVDEDDG